MSFRIVSFHKMFTVVTGFLVSRRAAAPHLFFEDQREKYCCILIDSKILWVIAKCGAHCTRYTMFKKREIYKISLMEKTLPIRLPHN